MVQIEERFLKYQEEVKQREEEALRKQLEAEVAHERERKELQDYLDSITKAEAELAQDLPTTLNPQPASQTENADTSDSFLLTNADTSASFLPSLDKGIQSDDEGHKRLAQYTEPSLAKKLQIETGLLDPFDFEKHLLANHYCNPLTASKYKYAIMHFYRTKPDITSIETYNTYLVNRAFKKRCTWLYFCLKRFINWKIQNKMLREKLINGLVKPQQATNYKRERLHLSEEDVLKVYNAFPDGPRQRKNRLLWLLEFQTGLRIGTILNIKKESVFEEQYQGMPVIRINTIGKGKKLTVVYIFDPLTQQLFRDYIEYPDGFNLEDKEELEKMPFINSSPKDKRRYQVYTFEELHRCNYRSYSLEMKKALFDAGFDPQKFASHDLRRGFARRFYEKYRDIHALMNVMSHADISTTVRYLQTSGLGNIEYHKEMQLVPQDNIENTELLEEKKE